MFLYAPSVLPRALLLLPYARSFSHLAPFEKSLKFQGPLHTPMVTLQAESQASNPILSPSSLTDIFMISIGKYHVGFARIAFPKLYLG